MYVLPSRIKNGILIVKPLSTLVLGTSITPSSTLPASWFQAPAFTSFPRCKPLPEVETSRHVCPESFSLKHQNQSTWTAPQQFRMFIWKEKQNFDVLHLFLSAARTMARKGMFFRHSVTCHSLFDRGMPAEVHWQIILIYNEPVGCTDTSERLCPLPWISASPQSQTLFFFFMIVLLFVSRVTFSIHLKAQNLKSTTVSTASSVNFWKQLEKSCGENQCNHLTSHCFDTITKKHVRTESYEHVKQERSQIISQMFQQK